MKLIGQIIIFVLGVLSFVLSGLLEWTKTKKQDKETRKGREIEDRQKRTFVRVEVEFFD